MSATASACAANGVCGCAANADCAGHVGPAGESAPVCDPADGYCYACVADSDCTGPDARVCDPTINLCAACRTSPDCANNGDGPACVDCAYNGAGTVCQGGTPTQVGDCSCGRDADCVGRAGGPHCQVQNGLGKCGCQSVTDCAQSRYGHACVNPYLSGWHQCGCAADSDCAAGKTCTDYACSP